MASSSRHDGYDDGSLPNSSSFHTPKAALRSVSRMNEPSCSSASLIMSRLKAESGVTNSGQADVGKHARIPGEEIRQQETFWFGYSPSPIIVNGTLTSLAVSGTDRTDDTAREISNHSTLEALDQNSHEYGCHSASSMPEMASEHVHARGNNRPTHEPRHSPSHLSAGLTVQHNGKPPSHSPVSLGLGMRESKTESKRNFRGSTLDHTPSPPTSTHTSLYKIDESPTSNGHRYSHVTLDYHSEKLPYRVTSRVDDFQAHWWVTLLRALRQRGGGREGVRSLALLIVMDTVYSFCEMGVGLLMGKIELVSDSFHLSFGCCVLVLSLAAMVWGRRPADMAFTYGYERLEVLAAFSNGLFLLFLSFSLAVECLHAFVEDEAEHKHFLVISALAHTVVNMIGVVLFRHHARRKMRYQRPRDMNHHAIFLHLLCDSIRSGGIVLTSFFLYIGLHSAESLCLAAVSLTVLLLSLPLVSASGTLLLQMTPEGVSDAALHKCLRQVSLVAGVEECVEARFWAVVPGKVVGTLCLRVSTGADEQNVLEQTHAIFKDVGISDLTVQIESMA